jgi:hypothetical protein
VGDQVEGDVDAAGLLVHLVGMPVDGRGVEGIDLGGLRDPTGGAETAEPIDPPPP